MKGRKKTKGTKGGMGRGMFHDSAMDMPTHKMASSGMPHAPAQMMAGAAKSGGKGSKVRRGY